MSAIEKLLAQHIKDAKRVKLTAVTPDGVNCTVTGDRRLAHDIGIALQEYFKREIDKKR